MPMPIKGNVGKRRISDFRDSIRSRDKSVPLLLPLEAPCKLLKDGSFLPPTIDSLPCFVSTPQRIASLNMQQRYSRQVFITKALRLVWVVVTLFGEVWVFFWSFFQCKWPSFPLASDGEVPSTRVLLVADTQIHHRALLLKDSWWFHPFRRVLFELNLRKSWHITSYLRPDAVVFLGDMLSNGKAAKVHQEYKAATNKFKSIFHTDPRTQVYYIPGNNDVGLGLDRSTSHLLRSFYQESFGALDHKFVLRNHTFVAINSAGLVDEDYLRNGEHTSFQSWIPLPNGTISFVKQQKQDPIILLSHIPLARAESAQCGPLREHGTIRRGAGPGWQSTLSKESSNFLLNTLRPSIIFSADNRDYCDHTHTSLHDRRDSSAPGYHVREITLKSFSMSVHIHRPGFQLLTLVDPAYFPPTQHQPTSHGPPSLAERACFLPDQFRIYNYLYAPLFILSLLILARFHFLKPNKGKFKIKPPFLAVKTGLASRFSEDRSLLSESPSNLNGPSTPSGAEPMWTPFAPFYPVTPLGQTLSSNMHQPSITSVKSTDSLYPPSRGSSLSSTTTLLSGENGGDGDCQLNNHEHGLIYDSPPDYTITKPEKVSFNFTSLKQWDTNYGPRHSYTRQSTTDLDLESFQDEVVDKEAATATAGTTSPKRTGWFLLRWSTSFVFRGRRRTIGLGLPSWSAVWNLMEFLGVVDERPSSLLDSRRRTSQRSGFIIDLVVVFFPATVLWLVVNGVSMLI